VWEEEPYSISLEKYYSSSKKKIAGIISIFFLARPGKAEVTSRPVDMKTTAQNVQGR